MMKRLILVITIHFPCFLIGLALELKTFEQAIKSEDKMPTILEEHPSLTDLFEDFDFPSGSPFGQVVTPRHKSNIEMSTPFKKEILQFVQPVASQKLEKRKHKKKKKKPKLETNENDIKKIIDLFVKKKLVDFIAKPYWVACIPELTYWFNHFLYKREQQEIKKNSLPYIQLFEELIRQCKFGFAMKKIMGNTYLTQFGYEHDVEKDLLCEACQLDTFAGFCCIQMTKEQDE